MENNYRETIKITKDDAFTIKPCLYSKYAKIIFKHDIKHESHSIINLCCIINMYKCTYNFEVYTFVFDLKVAL